MLKKEILIPLAISAAIYFLAALTNKNFSLSKNFSAKFINRGNVVSYFFLSLMLIITIDILLYITFKQFTGFSQLIVTGIRLGIFTSTLNIIFYIIKHYNLNNKATN